MNKARFEVRLETAKNFGTPLLQLPIIFKGTLQRIAAWAEMNHWRWHQDEQMLSGGYYHNANGETAYIT